MFSQYEAGEVGYLMGWTITTGNDDFAPHLFVVRVTLVGPTPPTQVFTLGPIIFIYDATSMVSTSLIGCLCDTLEEARLCVPADFTWFPRQEGDLSQIVESYI